MMTEDDLELLQKLEEANRRIEIDLKAPLSQGLTNSRSPELLRKTIRQDSISSDLSSLTIDSDGNPENEWAVWNKIVNQWSNYLKRKPQWIREMIRGGVPVHFRPLVWQCLAKVESSTAKEKFAEFMKMTSPCEKVIRRDISRTYPEHEFFKEKHGIGQERLFNVIKAYSLYDREVGYCQGIAFIVGLFLMHMPEEESFAILVSIMHDLSLRDMYKPDMFYLGLCMYQLECLIQEFLPDLYRHFQNEHIHTSMYASSWFLTLFTNQFSLPIVCRIMDLFLSEGIEMIFRLSLALLEFHQDELMLLSMEDMLKYFQKDVPLKHENDPETLFQHAFSVQYNSKKMKKLEKDYQIIRKEEQEEQIEIRRLRNENRLLKQRVDNLEKESATLANRLIEGQVLNAQYAEESYQLKRDISTLKKQIEDLAEQNSSTDKEKLRSNQTELENLREIVDRLTSANRSLQLTPEAEIAALQEQLTLVKMRDAEAQVNINELRQRLDELNRHWLNHQNQCQHQPNSHELLTIKMLEGQIDCEKKILSQNLMDVETQKQLLINQLKRQDEEIHRLRMEIDQSSQREIDLRIQLNEFKHHVSDGELRKKEDSMMSKIREAESTQMMGDLRQRIAELEVQNQELITRSQILDGKDLQEKLLELQDEVMRLRLRQNLHRKSSISIDYEESEEELFEPVSSERSRQSRSSHSTFVSFLNNNNKSE